MKKKEYIAPETSQFTVSLQQIIAFSDGNPTPGNPKVDPEPDNNTEPNRSRPTYNCWEDEEEEE